MNNYIFEQGIINMIEEYAKLMYPHDGILDMLLEETEKFRNDVNIFLNKLEFIREKLDDSSITLKGIIVSVINKFISFRGMLYILKLRYFSSIVSITKIILICIDNINFENDIKNLQVLDKTQYTIQIIEEINNMNILAKAYRNKINAEYITRARSLDLPEDCINDTAY
jgi:hypothetical protein